MRAKKMMTLFLCLMGLNLVAFQNWNYIELGETTIGPVNESTRIGHAKELLGKYYGARRAANMEQIRDLNHQILAKFQARLPKKYKKMAPQITQTLIEECEKHYLDPVFVMAMIATESNFNPLTIGGVGEIGLMQIRPETAAWITDKLGLKYGGKKALKNPVQNIRIGVAYISFLRSTFKSSATEYLAAYNMGPRNVRRLVANNKKPREYALKVMSNYRDLYTKMVDESRKAEMIQAQL